MAHLLNLNELPLRTTKTFSHCNVFIPSKVEVSALPSASSGLPVIVLQQVSHVLSENFCSDVMRISIFTDWIISSLGLLFRKKA